MRLVVMLAALAAVATASSIHYTPATTKIYLVKSDASSATHDGAPATTQYHEQDSGGFYSYGYSADRSAKAEYLTVDGSSKGFYSYIDADGKLQTVKYEAGGKQGFKAAATNLPKAPKVAKQQAPVPVKDTPEVQLAKKAHFEAYREAELRAALATQKDAEAQKGAEAAEEQRKENANIGQEAEDDIFALLRAHGAAEGGSNNDGDFDSGSEGEDGDDNGLFDLSELQQQENAAGNNNDNADDDNGGERDAEGDSVAAELSGANKDMTSYKLRAGLGLDPRELYSLDDTKDLLQLAQLQRKSELSYTPAQLTATETVRVPVHSYYTVLAPTTKYSVITPTILTSVPREEALKRGHSLPISLSSSFLSHRLKTK